MHPISVWVLGSRVTTSATVRPIKSPGRVWADRSELDSLAVIEAFGEFFETV